MLMAFSRVFSPLTFRAGDSLGLTKMALSRYRLMTSTTQQKKNWNSYRPIVPKFSI